MVTIDFDESRSPLYIITFKTVPTDDDFDAYLRRMQEIYDSGTINAFVLHIAHSQPMPGSLMRLQANWVRKNQDLIARFNRGTAFVFKSPLYHFVLSSIFLIQPLPTPYLVCRSRDEAIDWCVEQLRLANIHALT